jgi:hypothetical protein
MLKQNENLKLLRSRQRGDERLDGSVVKKWSHTTGKPVNPHLVEGEGSEELDDTAIISVDSVAPSWHGLHDNIQ